MSTIRKIDDVGRISLPKDLRRSLRWMGGDEIEIIPRDDETVVLRKAQGDAAARLASLRDEWSDDEEIQQQFIKLIELINNKK